MRRAPGGSGTARVLGGAARGRPEEEVEKEVRSLRRWLGFGDAIAPVCRPVRLHTVCYALEHDPAPAPARVRVPVLAFFGERDSLVPPERNIPLIEAGFRRGSAPLTIHTFSGANHQIWAARAGATSEYPRLRKEYVPGFFDTIGAWVHQQPRMQDGPGRIPRILPP